MIESVSLIAWCVLATVAMTTRKRWLRRATATMLVISVTVAVFVHGLTMFDGDVYYALLLAALPFMFIGVMMFAFNRLKAAPSLNGNVDRTE